ncbi:hypothetical protein GH721_08985 [Kriegella sp. EG-1]|nr:hypothetical protein [Flavobacteriaceae bacterium EG-1]
MKPEKLEEVFGYLLRRYKNIKAEVLISEIENNSDLHNEDFLIVNRSAFSRPYGGDVIGANLNDNQNRVKLKLSRNGLYDNLPEGLFHEQAISKDTKSYIERRKTIKEEEEESRLLFSPIENELFYQKLEIERNERNLLNDFNNSKNEFLFDFWKINRNIPKDYAVRLITLLPYKYKIVGNLELTKLSLEKILNEKVTIKRVNKRFSNEENNNETGFTLGHDTVLNSNEYGINIASFEFEIGPIIANKLDWYLNEFKIYEFLEVFYDYFIPMEMEVTTKLLVIKDCEFLLGDSNSSILGLSSNL